MRIENNRHRVFLSKRNLLSLLTKLGWPESKRTIVDADGDVAVTAESNEIHYTNRIPPGPMHPRTEAAIAAKNAVPTDKDLRDH